VAFLMTSGAIVWALALTGCGTVKGPISSTSNNNGGTTTATEPVVVQSSTAAIAINGTDQLSATLGGVPISGGQWVVMGGAGNGSIDSNGVLHAPQTIPEPATVIAGYVFDGQTYTVAITIQNPTPVVTSIAPSSLSSLTTSVQLTGSGFLPTSSITVNSNPIATTYVDSSHLSTVITLPAPLSTTLQIGVVNPDQGSNGTTTQLSAVFPVIQVQPAVLTGGSVSLVVSGADFKPGCVVFLNGKPLATVVNSSSSLSASGFLVPWAQGSAIVEVAAGDGTSVISALTVPIAPTAVTYDAAARFATQAALGPRPSLVQHIQQIGFDAFITEQFAQPTVVFPFGQNARHVFINAADQGNSLLRQRVSIALQDFIVPQSWNLDPSNTFIEDTFERDANANFRQLLDDISSDPNITSFLNLPNNWASTDPLSQPNQNFGRELMQLFSLGPFMLNDDGSQQVDSAGNPIPTYTQTTVIDMTRALTGWTYGTPVNPDATIYGVDFSIPLVGNDSAHDHTAKNLFGTVVLPAGQSIVQDRQMALDAIFNHPNLPPFISRLLIQHLVKSNPTPAYVQRISSTFEDDGTGTRGNLAAVVRAILLDPEARSGDTTPSPSDGFLQEPLLFQLFVMNALQQYGSDDQVNNIGALLGQPWWYSPTVFGSFAPTYQIPGTSINSPEFAIFNNISLIQRSNILWGIITGNLGGYSTDYQQTSWLFQNFTTVPDMVDALNHIVYHGMMSQQLQNEIVTYCSQLNPFDTQLQLESAIFLALNADSYNVSN
jgi:hypothetical protein